MPKIGAIMRLTRVEHSAMLVIAVIAAELIAGGIPALPIFLLSLITPVFISMSAFSINDFFDVEVDKANKKNRPIVSGEITRKEALWVTGICLFIGVIASIPINPYAFAIAIIFGALSLIYSCKLKETLFWGNAYIAFSMAIPFIYGSYVASDSMSGALILVVVMIFLTGLAREIQGTIRDLKGDTKIRNVRTFPKVIGVDASAGIALLLYFAAVCISAYLFFIVPPFSNNLAYALPILAVDVMLIYLGIGYMENKTERFYDFARNLSLAAMALALVAILLSALI